MPIEDIDLPRELLDESSRHSLRLFQMALNTPRASADLQHVGVWV